MKLNQNQINFLKKYENQKNMKIITKKCGCLQAKGEKYLKQAKCNMHEGQADYYKELKANKEQFNRFNGI